jgi:hypothetical protein
MVVFVVGIVLILIILGIAFLLPNPTPFQYTVIRIVLALAAAAFATLLSGFLQVQVSDYVKAGGALAVFVVVYFYSPARLVAVAPRI